MPKYTNENLQVYVPMLIIYGSESWILNSKVKHKITLPNIARVTRLNKVKNAKPRNEVIEYNNCKKIVRAHNKIMKDKTNKI